MEVTSVRQAELFPIRYIPRPRRQVQLLGCTLAKLPSGTLAALEQHCKTRDFVDKDIQGKALGYHAVYVSHIGQDPRFFTIFLPRITQSDLPMLDRELGKALKTGVEIIAGTETGIYQIKLFRPLVLGEKIL